MKRKLIYMTIWVILMTACSSLVDKEAKMEAAKAAEREYLQEATVTSEESEKMMLESDAYGYADIATTDEFAGAAAPTSALKAKTVDGDISVAQKIATEMKFRNKTPELLARMDGPDTEALPFISYDIYVVIAGHRARVVYDMIYKNPVDRQLSGNIMIELPDGASPSYLGMFQGEGFGKEASSMVLNPRPLEPDDLLGKELALGSQWEGQQQSVDWGEFRGRRVENPVKGAMIYESITRQRIDPALSSWAGGNNFSTKVFPIPASGHKRIVFAYDRTLKQEGGRYILPLPVPEKIEAATRLSVYTEGDSILEPVVLAGAESLTPQTSGKGLKWFYRPAEDFDKSLIFTGKPKKTTVQMIAGKDESVPGTLTHILYTPPIADEPVKRETGRALFLLDTSYSSKEKLYSLSGKMLRTLLEEDSTITDFQVVCFDVNTWPVSDGFIRNTRDNREKVLKAIENIWLEGATNFASVMEYLKDSADGAAADSIFLLSDGHITWGNSNTRLFEDSFPGILAKPWFCYTFGEVSSNRELFNTLSRKGGQIITVGLSQNLRAAASAHLKGLAHIDSINLNNGKTLIVQGDPQTLYPGQTLELGALLDEGAESVNLTITVNGRLYELNEPLSVNPATSALASRSWAELYVNKLLSLYDNEADKAALALSQHFSLTNRQASFIILETDEEYTLYEIEKQMLDLENIIDMVNKMKALRPYGAPDYSHLPEETREFIRYFTGYGSMDLFTYNAPFPVNNRFEILRSLPGGRSEKNTPRELYKWAMSLFKQKRLYSQEKALRALSTIVEEKSEDPASLRLVGYVLFQWGMYRESAEIFGKLRNKRPFEPQNHLLEALSLMLLGEYQKAAILFELVLRDSFPRFDAFTKPVASYFYTRMLKSLTTQYPQDRIASYASRRLEELTTYPYKKGRLLLFWNLDDTDVDLHVIESDGTEVYYSEPSSSTGGRLFWDNTTGLGPEFYEHPTLGGSRGFEVFVNYFGSSSVEGAAPAATLVGAITQENPNSIGRIDFYTTVLIGSDEDKISLMPPWR